MNWEHPTLKELISAGDKYLAAVDRGETVSELRALEKAGYLPKPTEQKNPPSHKKKDARAGWRSQSVILAELVQKKVLAMNQSGGFEVRAKRVVVGPPAFKKQRIVTIASISPEAYNQHARFNLTGSGVNVIGINQLNESFVSIVPNRKRSSGPKRNNLKK